MILERIGYCWMTLSTWCADPSQVASVQVEWRKAITDEVLYTETLPIAPRSPSEEKGYYRLIVRLKDK
jgi:hypothetical protein